MSNSVQIQTKGMPFDIIPVMDNSIGTPAEAVAELQNNLRGNSQNDPQTKPLRFDLKDFIKRVAVIAVPVALQNLLSTTGTMVDTMMIAPLGENAVGAVGLCSQYALLMLAGYWGFVGGGMLFFSQYWGAQDHRGIARSFGLTWTCMITVSIIFGGLALFAPQVIMRMYTDKVVIQEIGVKYLKVIGYAYPFQVTAISMSAMLRATERVKIPLYAAICSVFSNILLNWALIGGHWGFPAMGVRGAALATVIASAINVVVIMVLSAAAKYPYLFMFKDHFAWKGDKVREFFKKSLPIICNEVFIGIGNLTINMVLGRQSEQAIAALAVFRTFEGFIVGFFTGFSNASSVVVGKCVGAGSLRLAYERAKRLIPMCQICILLEGVLVNLVKPYAFAAMGLSGESFAICSSLVLIYSCAAVIRMGNWSMNDTFRASGDSFTGTALEMGFMYVLVLPAVCLAGLKFKQPILIVFSLCYCDEIIRYILMTIHLYTGKWIRPVTPEGRAVLDDFRRSLGKRMTKDRAITA